MKKYHLYLIVAIAGAAIVAIAILGIRILGPFYGVSLFLWSTLLSVTLAALSAGYLLGGHWADQEASAIRLNWMLLLAGCWLILIPHLKIPVLHLADFFGLRLALLIAAFSLFFPPLTLLGVITPYTIKLNTKNIAEVGQSAGNHYAISMMAGVFSVLLTSFLLIPNFGVTRLILVIGLILIQMAILGFWIDCKNRKKAVPVSVILLLFCFVLIWQTPTKTLDKKNGLLFVQQSSFGEISVVDKDEVRYLLINGAIQTMVRDSTLETLNRYGIAIDLCKELFLRPGKMLLLGLGGGAIVNDFIRDSWKVEAVEIDPVLIDVAQKFFNLNPDRCEIHEMDGRQFLLQKAQQYDFIVHNACLSPGNPSHLMISTEMFELLSSRLAKDGILAINVEAVGWDAALIKSIAMTLRQNFLTVLALPTSEPPNAVGSIVLLAANRKLEIDDAALGHPADFINLDSYLHWVVVQRNHAWDNRYEPDTVNAKLLTDDFNPIDLWDEEVNLAVRHKLRETFALNIQNY
jgi:spermidine synthase